MSGITRFFSYALVFSSVVCIDRITKMYALIYCQQPLDITSFVCCDLTFNRGISWSMFHADAQTPFVLVSGMVLLVTLLLGWYTYLRYTHNQYVIGELLVLAGSCSNIVDRLWYGGVADFIRIHYANWSYPSFNCADAAIVIGVICMIGEYYTE